MRSHKRREQRSGFSMVEVCLAILVLGIGLLSVVGLMGGGLDMSKATVDDTQVAQFANDVFEGIRAAAYNCTNTRMSLQSQLTAQPPLQPVAAPFWAAGQTIPLNPTAGFVPFYYAQLGGSNVSFVCRYSLQYPHQSLRSVEVELDVMSGAYGFTQTQSFYTAVCNYFR